MSCIYTVEVMGHYGHVAGSIGPFASRAEAERAMASVAARIGEPAPNNERVTGARLVVDEADEP